MYKKGSDFVRRIAEERIWRLFGLAEQEFPKHPERSKRYVEIARAIGKRNNVRIPAELKPKFCKSCSAFLVQGKNAEITRQSSNSSSFYTIKCSECGAVRKAKAA